MSWNHSPSDSSKPQWWSFHPPEGPRYGPPCSTHSLQWGKGNMSFKWRNCVEYLTPWYVSYAAKTTLLYPIVVTRCQLLHISLFDRFWLFGILPTVWCFESQIKHLEAMKKKPTWNCKESKHPTCWKPKGPTNIYTGVKVDGTITMYCFISPVLVPFGDCAMYFDQGVFCGFWKGRTINLLNQFVLINCLVCIGCSCHMLTWGHY